MAVNSKYKQYKNIIANNDKVASNSIGHTLSNRGLVSPAGLGSAILASANPNMMTADNRTGTGSYLPLSAGGGKTLPATQNAILQQSHLRDGSAQSAAKNVNTSGATVTDAVNNGNSVNSNINITGNINNTAGNSAVVGAVAPTVGGNANMSLAQYIAMAGGVDPNKQYNQSVKSAIADYERQKATYGANAEALAGMGLTNSGTSNYLDQAAYGSMQAAKAQAAAQRDADMTALAGQYINYQAQQEQQRQNTLMEAYNNAIKLGLSGDNMQKYLKAIVPNISQEEIDGLTAADDVVADAAAVNTFDEISQRLAQMVSTGSDLQAAADFLKSSGAYTPEDIDNVVNAMSKYEADTTAASQAAEQAATEAAQQQIYERLSPIASNKELANELSIEGDDPAVEDITSAIDRLVRDGNISEEQGKEIKNNAVGREAKALAKKARGGDKNAAMDLFVLAGEYGADSVADAIEFTWDYKKSKLGIKLGNKTYTIGYDYNNGSGGVGEVSKTIKGAPKEVYDADKSGWGIVSYNGKLYFKDKNGSIWREMGDAGGNFGTIKTGKEDEETNGKITQIAWDTVKQLLLQKVLKIESGAKKKSGTSTR